MVYLRARHYNPTIGRFTTRDSWQGDHNRPLSLNRWNYVEGNPVNRTDPSGLCWYPNLQTGRTEVDPLNPPPSGLCTWYINMFKQQGITIPTNSTTNNWLDGLPSNLRNKIAPYMLCSSANPTSPWFAGMDKLKLYPESKLYLDKYLPSWNGLKEIDPAEWDVLLHNFREDAYLRAQESKFWLAATAPNYDSQLFDAWGVLHGRACFRKTGKCYDRSQLNYFAEGELWAAVGVSKEQGHDIVQLWKRKSCFHLPVFGGGEVCMNPSAYDEPSKEVLEMFDEGYDDYKKYYPSTP